LRKDKIKNALTKNKNPPKKYKNSPHSISPKKIQKSPPKITKRPPKMSIWLLFSFLRSFCNVWGVFLYFFRGKTVGPFLYLLEGFLSFFGVDFWF
jgi:hypothetical protein